MDDLSTVVPIIYLRHLRVIFVFNGEVSLMLDLECCQGTCADHVLEFINLSIES